VDSGAVVLLEYACMGRAVEQFPPVAADMAAAAAADDRAPWLLAAAEPAALPQLQPLLLALRTLDFVPGGATVCLAPEERDYPFTTREAAAELPIAAVGADAATLAAARALGLRARMGMMYLAQRSEFSTMDEEQTKLDVAVPAAPGVRGVVCLRRPFEVGEEIEDYEILVHGDDFDIKLAAPGADSIKFAAQAPAAFKARSDPAVVAIEWGIDYLCDIWPQVIDGSPALMIDFPPAGAAREALLAAAARAADASATAFCPPRGYAEAAEAFVRHCDEWKATCAALERREREWKVAEAAVEAALRVEQAVEAAEVEAEAAAEKAARSKEAAAAPAKEEAAARRPAAEKPAAAKKAKNQ